MQEPKREQRNFGYWLRRKFEGVDMSFKVFVKDRNNRAASGVEVFVQWKSGTSRRRTDENGIADTEVNSGGTVEYIQINGQKQGKTNFAVASDEVVTFTLP